MPNSELTHDRLAIPGLGKLDEIELEEILKSQVNFEATVVPEGSLAEPATITAVVTLGSMALSALAVWLSKRRRTRVREGEFELRRPDGTVIIHRFKNIDNSEDAAGKQILAQLQEWIR